MMKVLILLCTSGSYEVSGVDGLTRMREDEWNGRSE